MNAVSDIEPLLKDHRMQWQSVADAMASANLDVDSRRKIEQLALASNYALRQLQRTPDLIRELLDLQGFEAEENIIDSAPGEKIDLDQVKQALRRYRHRKLVEIIYLDVVAGAAVDTTLRRLSDLADQLIRLALEACNRHLADKHGQPVTSDGAAMELNLIAMGKLGGRELNFSSDIDLICCFEHEGELSGYGQLSYQEYFSLLVRLLSQVLSDATADGFVYRVDLRLRPWGESGPVVLNHAAIEHYYQLHGREWEQYAMVKARVITGSAGSRAHLESILRPFVYRKYHDYRVFEGLAALKDKIDAQARSRGMKVNIKIGQGGIREIEFFVQAFQILRGGRNRHLQQTEIFACFSALEQHGIVDPETLAKLREAYCFLRLLENRIQMYDDQQTHDLPENPTQQTRIALTLGYSDWQSLLAELERHRGAVRHCFDELFRRESEKPPEVLFDSSFAEAVGDAPQREFIAATDIEDADEINRQLNLFLRSKAWNFMSARAKQRFSILLPELIAAIRGNQEPAVLFGRFVRLFSSIAGRSVYFELLVQNPALLQRLAALFGQSEWIANEVSDYPMLLENLIQPGDPGRFDKAALFERLQQQLANVAGDTELELDTLRLFKRDQNLVIASAELAREIDAIEVSRYLSELAEVILESVYRLASNALRQRHGIPECTDQDGRREANFAVIGYGKLGGLELHYQSDLDVIFLHDSEGEAQYTSGDKCIENSVFFARLAQKIISMTSVLTASGKLYEIDSRLRPEGSSGLLVSSLSAYLRYQLEKAWTWEHQALVRARMVAGSPALGPPFDRIRTQVLQQPRAAESLAREIADMRERIYRSKRPPEGPRKDLKHSRGGMVDIEFLVQYWVLLWANSVGSDRLYSDNISLLNELFRLGLITTAQSRLVEIYQTYHRLLHETVLQNLPAEVDAASIAAETEHVMNCWNECFGLQEN